MIPLALIEPPLPPEIVILLQSIIAISITLGLCISLIFYFWLHEVHDRKYEEEIIRLKNLIETQDYIFAMMEEDRE